LYLIKVFGIIVFVLASLRLSTASLEWVRGPITPLE
jgi:hypothetical protein